MELVVQKKAGVDVWSIRGSLLIQDMRQAKESIVEANGEQKRILLDLTDVEACDTAGLQLLCSMIQMWKEKGRIMDIPTWPESVLACANTLGINLSPTT